MPSRNPHGLQFPTLTVKFKLDQVSGGSSLGYVMWGWGDKRCARDHAFFPCLKHFLPKKMGFLTKVFEEFLSLLCEHMEHKLDHQIRTCSTISQFKTALLSIIRPAKIYLHEITNRHHTAFITRLRVHFSDLNEHRFHHNFACESPICNCKEGVESTTHFLLHCPLHLVHRNNLLGEISDILNNDVTQLPGDHLCNLLLFGS